MLPFQIESGYSLTQSALLLYAFQNERLIEIPIEQIADFKNIMVEHLAQLPDYPTYEQQLETIKELPEAIITAFELVITKTKEEFVCLD